MHMFTWAHNTQQQQQQQLDLHSQLRMLCACTAKTDMTVGRWLVVHAVAIT